MIAKYIERLVFWWNYGRFSTEELRNRRGFCSFALYVAETRGDSKYIDIFQKDMDYIDRALTER